MSERKIDLGELERLAEEATPGPWDVLDLTEELIEVISLASAADPQCVVARIANVVSERPIGADDRANAALIAALRNAAPELIAMARTLERELAAVTAERDEARAELARALRDRDNALELAAQVCVDEVNRNMDEYARLPQNVSRRVIYAAMGVAATNCLYGIREIIDSRSNKEAGR